jgi:hypothetical protein
MCHTCIPLLMMPRPHVYTYALIDMILIFVYNCLWPVFRL